MSADRQGAREELAAALREIAAAADAIPCDMDCDPHACPSCSQPVQVFSTVDGRIMCVFGEPEGFADALLPVVERLCDQRAAEALESTAELLAYTPLSERESGDVSDYTLGWHNAATVLRGRASALSRPERAETHPSGTPGPPEHGTEALRAK